MRNLTFTIFVLLLILAPTYSHSDEWRAPIGIPTPEFGIEESHMMYRDRLFDFDRDGTPEAPYRDAGSGPYTHYIDNTHPAATDANNPYGTADKPRMRMPDLSDIQPGSVMEIHGGPYSSGRFWFTSSGTQIHPIFIRGASVAARPVFHIPLMIRGHYVIVENIEFDRNGGDTNALSIRSWSEQEQVHHVAVRYCKAHNVFAGDGGNSAVMGASGLSDGSSDVHDIVYYKNEIRAGDVPPAPVSYEKDTVGISFGQNAQNIWIVDNEISECMGDAVGAGHGAQYNVKNIYVGRNHMHHCGENAVDIKEVDTVILSQNTMHDFYGASAGSSGTAVVIHYGPELSPKNVWVLFNEMYNTNSTGIQVGGSQEHDVFIVGNLIHHITNTNGDATAYRTWNSEKVYIINNTFYNVDNGISSHVQKTTAQLILRDNIFSNVHTSGYFFSLEGTQHCDTSELANNLFYQDAGEVRVRWNGNSSTLAQFQTTHTDKCLNCIEANPLFVNAENGNFNLHSSSSRAVDAGDEHAVYQWFFDQFGLNIRFDHNGAVRPHNAVWDIGAFEFGATPLNIPASPTHLRIE